MFENRLLRTITIAAARRSANIRIHAPAQVAEVTRAAGGVTVRLVDGTRLEAPLVVGAEGRRSPLRESAGIRLAQWRYDHDAIVTAIEHERAHGNVAFELFYPDGPFAILPMNPGTRSAIVWSVPPSHAAAYLALAPRALEAELVKRMGGFLGPVRLLTAVSTYPLTFQHAERYVASRLALAGDAAHGIHPIAGQGLNLGLRDVAALTEVLVDAMRIGLDLGDAQVLARYQRWRRLDSATIAGAGDVLTRMFGVPGRSAAAIRRLGLAAIERITPLKQLLMAEARGETGDLPKLLRGQLA